METVWKEVYSVIWWDKRENKLYDAAEFETLIKENRVHDHFEAILKPTDKTYLLAYCPSCQVWHILSKGPLPYVYKLAAEKAKDCKEYDKYTGLLFNHAVIMQKYFTDQLSSEELHAYLKDWVDYVFDFPKIDVILKDLERFQEVFGYPFIEELKNEIKVKAVTKSLKR